MAWILDDIRRDKKEHNLQWGDFALLYRTHEIGNAAGAAFLAAGLFWGLTLGANYQALSGLPRDRNLSVAFAQGTTNQRVEPRGTYRADNLSLLSLRAEKSFRFSGSNRASFIAELHNALNSNAGQVGYGTVTRNNASQAAFDAARAAVSYFGRIQEIVAPRVLKIGLKFDF